MGKPDAGDALVGAAMFGLAFLVLLGLLGIPFLDWIAEICLIVAGVMMIRGALGTNATVGWALAVLGPVLFVLPGFMPAVAAAVGFIAVFGLLILGGTKFFALW